MALAKRKVDTGGDDIATDKPAEKTAKSETRDGLGGVLALVPESSRRRRTAKKATNRRRVKNPAPGKAKQELTPEEALAQAWQYTYNNRKGFQQ